MKPFVLALLLTGLLAGCGRHAPGPSPTAPPATPEDAVPGVDFQQVILSKFPEHMRVWVYTPKDGRKTHPCVFIAPAGSALVTGMSLADGDRDEHLPYVRAGYTVVAYDVSGPKPSSPAGMPSAMRLFAKRNMGIANGKAAIDYALRRLKIDPLRLYTVGHSSAATLALQLAAADSRIRGCVAYAPITDIAKRLGTQGMAQVQQMAPELTKEIKALSPSANLDDLRCPIMLFTAEDDDNVPSETVSAFAHALVPKNHDVDLVTVPSGGHYDSMIRQGIPDGIRWLGRSRRPKR